MSIFVYLYYSFAFVIMFLTVLNLLGISFSKIINGLLKNAKTELEENKKLDPANPDSKPKIADSLALTFVMFLALSVIIPYIMWLMVGLLTSQWKIFLTIIGWLILNYALQTLLKGYITLARIVGTFFAIGLLGLLVFLVLNRFHLHWI